MFGLGDSRGRALRLLVEMEARFPLRAGLRCQHEEEVLHYSLSFGADSDEVRRLRMVQRVEAEHVAYAEIGQ